MIIDIDSFKFGKHLIIIDDDCIPGIIGTEFIYKGLHKDIDSIKPNENCVDESYINV